MTPGCSRKKQRGAASTWVFVGFAAVALFFLVTEHRAHLYGWLPYLLLAACPLMHLFHGGHGGQGGHGAEDERRRRDDNAAAASGKKLDTAAPPAAHYHH